jgi:hypothetical protein
MRLVFFVIPALCAMVFAIRETNPGPSSRFKNRVGTGVTSTPCLSRYQPALAKGNFDKDDKDEIAVGFKNFAYVLDDRDSDCVVIRHYNGYAYRDVFNGDRRDDVEFNGECRS